MRKLTRCLATCLLVVSISAGALADGGETQGPPNASLPLLTESTTGGSAIESSAPTQASSIDMVTEATVMLATWLEAAIF
ncbi:MAG: hypothetical protein ACMG6H_01755 [Acidobacteriota bacterium]